MDPNALHNLVGLVLALTTRDEGACSGSTEGKEEECRQLKFIISGLHGMDPHAMQALVLEVLGTVNGNNGNNSGTFGQEQANPLATMLGAFLGGQPFVCQGQQNPLGGLAEALLGGAGFGNGSCEASGAASANESPVNPMVGLLGTFLGGKGCGKGGWPQDVGAAQAPVQAQNPMEAMLGTFLGKGYKKGASAPTPPSGATATAEHATRTTTTTRMAFDDAVDDLVNMGLVSDRQMARELLTKHGDISAVVAGLTEGF